MTNTFASIITAIHLAALSQIESGDNDKAIGKAGEVSRYQIAPDVWWRETVGIKLPCARDEKLARIVAFDLWERRVLGFQLARNRAPDLQELYLLWHRPARVLQPRPREKERAERFASLVRFLEKK